MVADKETTAGQNQEAPAQTNNIAGSPRQLPPIKTQKMAIIKWLLFLLIIISAGWIVADRLHIGQKVYAQAAGHKIYKKDVLALRGKSKGVTDHQAATVLADKYLTEAIAKKNNITVSKQDVEKAYGKDFAGRKDSNRYSYQLAVNQLYFNKLQIQNQGDYKGELLVAHFSRYIAYDSPLLAEQKAGDSNIGNPDAIAKDKAYAQTFITNLYNQIKSKKITFAQAIQQERADPQVGEAGYPTLTHSGQFDTSSPYSAQGKLIQTKSIQPKIQAMRAGEISKPFVVKVSNAIDNSSTAESYFLVVHMKSTSGGNHSTSFNEELMQYKKQLGYKVNV